MGENTQEREKEEAGQRFRECIAWLTKVLFAHSPIHDPADLVLQHYPEDEYEGEARMILRELADCSATSLDDIRNVVHGVVARHFGALSAGPVERLPYSDIANELLVNEAKWRRKHDVRRDEPKTEATGRE